MAISLNKVKSMNRKSKIAVAIAVVIVIFAGFMIYENSPHYDPQTKVLANTSIGTVEKITYGNPNATVEIALITGIHPRETLSIEPEIKAAEEYAGKDVKIINYKITVTDHPQDYNLGRANGESLVHDYVNPDVTKSNAKAVIIAHSHIPEYGEGFYLATPAMDSASVKIAEKINETSDFNYYPVTGNETYKSTSAILVSRPIAEAGYPTFVYEIPENIKEQDSTDKTKELFDLICKNL